MGANDHGKTNILEALTHLNQDKPFEAEDLNWELHDRDQEFPIVTYTLTLSQEEKESVYRNWLDQYGVGEQPSPESPDSEGQADSHGVPSSDAVPNTAVLERQGVGHALQWPKTGIEMLDAVIEDYLQHNLPRVELIRPFESLEDTAESGSLILGTHEFMQGIFFTAGLDPSESDALFDLNDQSSMALNNANDALDRNLRVTWGQGREAGLAFKLENRNGQINLLIEDPAIRSRYVRASRRSSGFTHFFATSMVLHARRKKLPAASYIFLFDEPGIYLHPSGQRDFLQMLESLSQTSQIAYATHSLFMINRNYPTRHRLVFKDETGRRQDSKPYVGRWGSALDALGLSLPGTILFAPYVLLTEGDADPVYIHALLQWLIEHDQLDNDINGFSALSTENSQNTKVLVELLSSSGSECRLAVLVDGDKGGRERLKNLETYLSEREIPSKFLIKDTAIEDHVPFVRELYVAAVASYYYRLAVDNNLLKDDGIEDIQTKVECNFAGKFPDPGGVNGVAEWASNVGRDVYDDKWPGNPSKTGIAREYVALLQDHSSGSGATGKQGKRSKDLAKWIVETLGLPTRYAEQSIIG